MVKSVAKKFRIELSDKYIELIRFVKGKFINKKPPQRKL